MSSWSSGLISAVDDWPQRFEVLPDEEAPGIRLGHCFGDCRAPSKPSRFSGAGQSSFSCFDFVVWRASLEDDRSCFAGSSWTSIW